MMSTIKNGATPVYIASQNGHLGVVECLVNKAHADPNTPDKVVSRAKGAWNLFVRVSV